MEPFDRFWERSVVTSLKINPELDLALREAALFYSRPENRVVLEELMMRRGVPRDEIRLTRSNELLMTKSTLVTLAIADFMARFHPEVVALRRTEEAASTDA